MGGTFPALIWAGVISAWQDISAERAAEAKEKKDGRNGEESRSSGESSAEGILRAPEHLHRTGEPAPEEAPRPNPKRRPKEAAPEAAPEPKPPRNRAAGSAAAPAARPPALSRRARPETCGLPARQKRQGRSTAFVIPTRGPVTISPPSRPGAAGQERVRGRSAPLASRPTPERLGQLARARAELGVRRAAPRRRRISRQAVGRLERPDQHRRRVALGLGDEVEQAVDPVGEVDVGPARGPNRTSVRSVRPT